MNIGIVTTWFERGAGYVSRQYRDVLQGRHNVYIFARGGEGLAKGDPEWDDENVHWADSPAPPVVTGFCLEEFGEWLRSRNIQVLLFNEQHWWEPVLFAQDRGAVVGSYIDYYTRETVPLFGCYDFLVCNTRRHYSVFDWHPQVRYVPWGTDLQVFSPAGRHPDPDRCRTFFHSAGMSPERKGTDLVLEAFRCLPPPHRLVVHSQVDLRRRFPALGGLLRDLCEEGRLELVEQSVGPPGLYHLGDVYVYPSRLDGIGLTVPEALACGLPVITSDCAPMNEFVDPEVGRLVTIESCSPRSDGYYWPECHPSPGDLFRQMADLAAMGEGIQALQAAARRRAQERFDWKQNARNLPEFFEKVQASAKSRTENLRSAARKFDEKNFGLKYLFYKKLPATYRFFKRVKEVVQ